MNTNELPLLLTVAKTAELLRTSRQAVYAMVERGLLPGVTRSLAGASAEPAMSSTSRCRSLQGAAGSRKFVVDLPANRLGPGWRQRIG
jgi:saccharopine dehydrogenase-like NADP-dependent oxidoreductase